MKHEAKALRIIEVDQEIGLSDALAVVEGRAHLAILGAARARCKAAESRLQQCIDENRHVYGVTTGFGPLANRLVSVADGMQLQQNLVHHLASGVGPYFTWRESRAIVLARLMSILQGVSGASDRAISTLDAVLRSPLAPRIPSRGTVGASGDLTPLAHLVLCLQGRGDFLRSDGAIIPGDAALAELHLPPLTLERRDGLALVNGTSAMTGLAVLNAAAMRRSIGWAISLTGVLAEALGGHVEAWHAAFAQVRPHPGQAATSEALRRAVAGGDLVERGFSADRTLTAKDAGQTEPRPGQDAYTLRCASQIIGGAKDTLTWHDEIVLLELNSATDNPIFPGSLDVLALHGGNFMGVQVGLASDALSTASAVLAGLAERQIARVTDERLNGGLPAFLHQGAPGLNSGFMGAQVTATALLAELRSGLSPVSAQSISTNAANQDVVSMGTVAARRAGEHLRDLGLIQSILALCVVQASCLRQRQLKGTLSPNARAVTEMVRSVSRELVDDRPLSQDIEALATFMGQTPSPQEGVGTVLSDK
ncbi:MAG: aromatic amino acid ammonia-lyase [Pseudomonadota bacterium]